jgi:CBS domain-containing protein
MSKSLLSVRPEAPLDEVQHMLETRDISAAPVVDASGMLCGIVSSSDLLREAELTFSEGGRVTNLSLPARTAADVMRAGVITVGVDEPLCDAAAKMVDARVHRLVVMAKGAPIGVVSTRDAMRAVLFHRVEQPLSSVMSAPVLAIDIGDSIESAVKRLAEANVHGLVVLDDDKPVGVFTQREAIQTRTLPASLRTMPIEHIMSYQVLALDAATPLYRVAGYAIQTRVRRILVVQGTSLVGVVTGFDVLRVMTRPDA